MALILATFISAPASRAQDNVNVGGAARSTVLPTDVVPLPLAEERRAVGESLKLRLWQRLPSRFYMNATCETSGRVETNVFQFPMKRTILNAATFNRGVPFSQLSQEDVDALAPVVARASQRDNVFRVTPNITAGWALRPTTNVFVNYFYLRDKLAKFNQLNTYINQVGAGVEHNIRLPKRCNLELQFTARELWQASADPVFDYLPSTTITVPIKNNTIAYFNALAQFRSLQFFGRVNREIDPFFTIGALHQRGPWSFSANMTYLTNFRRGFKNAAVQINSQTIICDFEIAKQLFKKLPGFQGFFRAEPVYNFGTDNTPGLAGMDFRFFYGLRGAVSKPALVFLPALKKRYQQDPAPQQQPQQNKGKSKNQKGNTASPSDPNKAPGSDDPNKTAPADGKEKERHNDPPGGPSAHDTQSSPSSSDTPNTSDAPVVLESAVPQKTIDSPTTATSSSVIPRFDTGSIPEAVVPMHGFITETEKEVADANLASGLVRAKQSIN